MHKKFKLFIIVLVAVAAALSFWVYVNQSPQKSKATGNTIRPTGTYTHWIWPGQNYQNFEWLITPNIDLPGGPEGYFYSHQFHLGNGTTAYAGIQGGSNGKQVIFSVWDALEAQGPETAQPFGGEGVGYQTLIPYNWTPGRAYKFRVERMETASNGIWWGATVTDTVTGVNSFIGKIRVPGTWADLNGWSLVWIERYWGPMTACSDITYSSASFTNLTANNGSVRPISRSNYLSDPPGCPGSYITNILDGVRHEMAGSAPPIITEGEGTPVSNLSWISATNGSGPVEKDMSNGEPPTQDGKTITLNNQRYAKGLGVHALSEIRYNLNGQYSRFTSDIGLDDEASGSAGSVLFQVWADGNKLYDSGVMTNATLVKNVNVDVSNAQILKLIVTDGGDGIAWDHADWANARLVAAAIIAPTATPTLLPSFTPTPRPPTPTLTRVPSPSITPVSCDKAQGDANCDGHTTLTDYEIWRREYTEEVLTKLSDFNRDTKIELLDYEIWRRNYAD